MAELLKNFVEYGFKIKEALDKAGHNAEVCRRIGDLLNTLSANAKHLFKIMENDLMRDTAEGLQKALQRASKFVAKCQRKGLLSRAFNANDIAQKLSEVCLDVQLNMTAVLLANSAELKENLALNNSVLAELKENLAQLRADNTYTNSMVAKILQIVAAQPDLHLRKEVEKLVEGYQISSQIKNKEETKKTDVPSSQNKNKNARPEFKIQKNNKLRASTVVPHASLPDGLAESASAASVVVQYDGSSTIINKASSSISKLEDEVQSVGVSAAPFKTAFKTMIAVMEVNLPIANTSNASGLIPGINKE